MGHRSTLISLPYGAMPRPNPTVVLPIGTCHAKFNLPLQFVAPQVICLKSGRARFLVTTKPMEALVTSYKNMI